MKSLYLTADSIGIPTGGGCVTAQELLALQEISEVAVIQPLSSVAKDNPFYQDRSVLSQLEEAFQKTPKEELPLLAHCYSGCLSESVLFLKENGVKVSYTAAAHDLEESKKEHAALGLSFNYTHLTDEFQWDRYTVGYRNADVVIAPSTCAKQFMKSLRCKNVMIVPHGCHKKSITSVEYPTRFTVGYLGAFGPDKGVRYLLEAWKKLSYPEATLILAGRDSISSWTYHLIDRYGGGSIRLLGWVDDLSDFYNSISLYVQPSVTEGFGLEVLESLQYGRPVLCSLGAGAHDVVPDLWKFFPRDVEELARKIDACRMTIKGKNSSWGEIWQEKTIPYTWDKIRKQYQKIWRGLFI